MLKTISLLLLGALAVAAHAQLAPEGSLTSVQLLFSTGSSSPYYVEGEVHTTTTDNESVHLTGALTLPRVVTGDTNNDAPWDNPYGYGVGHHDIQVPYDLSATIPAVGTGYWAKVIVDVFDGSEAWKLTYSDSTVKNVRRDASWYYQNGAPYLARG